MRNRRKTKVTTSTRKIAAKKTAEPKPNVRNKARVTVKKAVDGTVTRKKSNGATRRSIHRAAPVTVSQFPPELLLDAQQALRPGEKLVVVSDTEAKTVYL